MFEEQNNFSQEEQANTYLNKEEQANAYLNQTDNTDYRSLAQKEPDSQKKQAYTRLAEIQEYKNYARFKRNEDRLYLGLNGLLSKRTEDMTPDEQKAVLSGFLDVLGISDKTRGVEEQAYAYFNSHDLTDVIDNKIRPVINSYFTYDSEKARYAQMSDEKLLEEFKKEEGFKEYQKISVVGFGSYNTIIDSPSKDFLEKKFSVDSDEFKMWKLEKTKGLNKRLIEMGLASGDAHVWKSAVLIASTNGDEDIVGKVIDTFAKRDENGNIVSYDNKLHDVQALAKAMNPDLKGGVYGMFAKVIIAGKDGIVDGTSNIFRFFTESASNHEKIFDRINKKGGLDAVLKDKKLLKDIQDEFFRPKGFTPIISDVPLNQIYEYFENKDEIPAKVKAIYENFKSQKEYRKNFKNLVFAGTQKYAKEEGVSKVVDYIADAVGIASRWVPSIGLSVATRGAIPPWVGLYADQTQSLIDELKENDFADSDARIFGYIGGIGMTALERAQVKALKTQPFVANGIINWVKGDTKKKLSTIFAEGVANAVKNRGKLTIQELVEETSQNFVQEATIQIGAKLTGAEAKSFDQSMQDFLEATRDMIGGMVMLSIAGGGFKSATMQRDSIGDVARVVSDAYQAKKLGDVAQLRLIADQQHRIIEAEADKNEIKLSDVREYFNAKADGDVETAQNILGKYKDPTIVEDVLERLNVDMLKLDAQRIKIVGEALIGWNEVSDEREWASKPEEKRRTTLKLLDEFHKVFGLEKQTIYVNSVDELDQETKKQILGSHYMKGSSSIEEALKRTVGFNLGDKVVIIGSSVRNPLEALATLKHERVHLGVKGFYGSDEYKNLMKDVIDLYGGLDLIKEAYKRLGLGGYLKDRRASTDESATLFLGEELLARVAEKVLRMDELSAQEQSVWEKVVDWMTARLSSVGNLSDVYIAKAVNDIWGRGRTGEKSIERRYESEDESELMLKQNAQSAEDQYNEVKAQWTNPDMRFSVKADRDALDKEYRELYERYKSGDKEAYNRAKELVVSEGLLKGYFADNDFRMSHKAPNRFEDDVNASLHDIRERDILPKDFWQHPEWYAYSAEEKESFRIIKEALGWLDNHKQKGDGKIPSIKVYRAVPKDVKEDSVRNGDWVTPSKAYARQHGESNLNGEYRIITKLAKLNHLYFNGDSIAELGYDDGESYAYKNTKNNRKLLDPFTLDDDGNLIPLTKRFNQRNSDINFSIIGESGKLDYVDPNRKNKTLRTLLDEAKEYKSRSFFDDVIYELTGWQLDDGVWKYDVDEGDVVIPKDFHEGESKSLEDFLPNSPIFEIYPILKDVVVEPKEENSNVRGYINFGDGKIVIVLNSKSYGLETTLVHEVQHAIQKIEKWARGGSNLDIEETLHIAKQALKYTSKNKFFQKAKGLIYGEKANKENASIAKEFLQLVKKLYKVSDYDILNKDLEELAKDLYLDLKGELEARNASIRTTLANRKKTSISKTEPKTKRGVKLFISENEFYKLLDIREELKNVYGYEEEISKYERRRYNGVLGRKSLSQDQRYTSFKENISKNPLEILEDKESAFKQRAEEVDFDDSPLSELKSKVQANAKTQRVSIALALKIVQDAPDDTSLTEKAKEYGLSGKELKKAIEDAKNIAQGLDKNATEQEVFDRAKDYYLSITMTEAEKSGAPVSWIFKQLNNGLAKAKKRKHEESLKQHKGLDDEFLDSVEVDLTSVIFGYADVYENDENPFTAEIVQQAIDDLVSAVELWAEENKITKDDPIFKNKVEATLKNELIKAIKSLEYGANRERAIARANEIIGSQNVESAVKKAKELALRVAEYHKADVENLDKATKAKMQKELAEATRIFKERLTGRLTIRELRQKFKERLEKTKDKYENKIANLKDVISAIRLKYFRASVLKGIKVILKKGSTNIPKSREINNPITSDVMYYFGCIKKFKDYTQEEVEERIKSLTDDINKLDGEYDDKSNKVIELEALLNFGGWENFDIVRLMSMLSELKGAKLSSGESMFFKRLKFKDKTDKIVNAFTKGVEATKSKKKKALQALSDSLTGVETFPARLREMFSDGTAETKKVIEDLIQRVSYASQHEREYIYEWEDSFETALKSVFGDKFTTSKEFSDLVKPKKEYTKFSLHDNELSKANLLQLYASFQQQITITSIRAIFKKVYEQNIGWATEKLLEASKTGDLFFMAQAKANVEFCEMAQAIADAENIYDEITPEFIDKFLQSGVFAKLFVSEGSRIKATNFFKQVKMVNDIKETLSEKDIKLLEQIKVLYKNRRPLVNQVLKSSEAMGFPMVENDPNYIPMKREGDATLVDVGEGIPLIPDHTIQRRINYRPFDENADIIGMFNDIKKDDAHFITFNSIVAELQAVFLHPKLVNAMRKKYTASQIADFNTQLRSVLNSSILSDNKKNSDLVGKTFSGINSAMATMAMMWNVISASKQISSAVAMQYEHIATFDVAGVDWNFDDFWYIFESKQMKARAGSAITPEMSSVLSSFKNGDSAIKRNFKQFVKKMRPFILTTQMDRLVSSIANVKYFRAQVNHFTKLGYSESVAKDMAVNEVVRCTEATQQSTLAMYSSSAERGGWFGKLMMTFKKQPQQMLSYEVEAFKTWRKEQTPEARSRFFKILFMNHIVMPMIFNGIGLFMNALLGDVPEDDEEWMLITINGLLDSVCGVWWSSIIKGSIATMMGFGNYDMNTDLLPSLSYTRFVYDITSLIRTIGVDQSKVGEKLEKVAKDIFPPARHILKAVENAN